MYNDFRCFLFQDDEHSHSQAKRIILEGADINSKENLSSILSDHNTFKQITTKTSTTSSHGNSSVKRPQKRSASHIKTLDSNLDVDHSFDFVRTLSAENIKLQEANVRLREAENKRVHEHACLQKKVKRMERERLLLLNGLEESGFTETQIDFIKRKGVAELHEDSKAAKLQRHNLLKVSVIIVCSITPINIE